MTTTAMARKKRTTHADVKKPEPPPPQHEEKQTRPTSAPPPKRQPTEIRQRYVPPDCSACFGIGEPVRYEVTTTRRFTSHVVRYCKCPRCGNTYSDYKKAR